MVVTSEWGEVVCKESCDSFLTPPLTDGESILYWVSKPAASTLKTDDYAPAPVQTESFFSARV